MYVVIFKILSFYAQDLCVNDYTESSLCNSDDSICNPPPLPPPDMIGWFLN